MATAAGRLVRFFATLVIAVLRLDGVGQTIPEWSNVCIAEEYVKLCSGLIICLCPETFTVSTLAFNPLYPLANATVTLIVRPSRDLPSSVAQEQFIHLTLNGFLPLGPVSADDASVRDHQVVGRNLASVGETPYNTEDDPVFDSVMKYDMDNQIYILKVKHDKTLLSSRDTEVEICCLRLPTASIMDDPAYRIEAPTSLEAIVSIGQEAIKSSPFIDAGFQWQYLRVDFDPPASRQPTVISLTFRSANDLINKATIVMHLPSITRSTGESGLISFNTRGSGDGSDWMLFDHQAKWNNEEKKVTFYLREGQILKTGRTVTLNTEPGDFILPLEMSANWDNLMVEARSFDDVDSIISATSVLQSSPVPQVREFLYSQLAYVDDTPEGFTNVNFIFNTNRPMFAGTKIYMRLSNFRARVTEVPILGVYRHHFRQERAFFDLPRNIIELDINQTLYSDEKNISVILTNLKLPPALYANDISLRIWTSDSGAQQQPIMVSPPLGGGVKSFIRSQVQFFPSEPRMPANVTFIIMPSVFFYQGDKVVLHLYGFLCEHTRVPLLGPGASQIEDNAGVWYPDEYKLILTVAENKIISNVEPLLVEIGKETNFRLPDKLSEKDGILRIEGVGAYIDREGMKKVPQIGDLKFVIDSRLEFETIQATYDNVVYDYARVTFKFVLNCDILPNSTIYIYLGGLLRSPPGAPLQAQNDDSMIWGRTGTIPLSGPNAPIFVGEKGDWDQDKVELKLKIVHTVPAIYAGFDFEFFIERDQYFRLPFAAYPNDPTFQLFIPEAGIPKRPFKFSTRINRLDKEFTISTMTYTSGAYAVVEPSKVVEINLKFSPFVDLPGGSIVVISLPGFTYPDSNVPLATPPVPITGETDLSSVINAGRWDPLKQELSLEVPTGRTLYRGFLAVMRVLETNGFRLPATSLDPNDQNLTIQSKGNLIIKEAPIKSSPRVVDRSFIISKFEYLPPKQESIFLMLMTLQPTVNITHDNDIIIFLPKFRNSLSKLNIHIMGEDRYRIKDSMAQWNETTKRLTMPVVRNQPIEAFTLMHLRIEESQGFILPEELDANDTRLIIEAKNSIPPKPVKDSPMVGNGPKTGHLFCMYQYERGVRTTQPVCTAAQDKDPPLTDPCSVAELDRCGCDTRLDEIFPMKVLGFNLQEQDQVNFIPGDTLCSEAAVSGPSVLSSFSLPTKKELAEDGGELEFTGISSIDTGKYRICYKHVGNVFDVGFVVVRPSCEPPLVMVGGTCVEHCPKQKIPIEGECRRDRVELGPSVRDNQAMKIAIRMDGASVSSDNLQDRSSDDGELRYFIYRYTYEMARLLDCDPKRINVVSITEGSSDTVLVHTVFATVGDAEALEASTERSPLGLINLLRALQNDRSSQLYTSVFFNSIDRSYQPEPLKVRECEDGLYRVFCPYNDAISSGGTVVTLFILGFFLVPVCLLIVGFAAWRIDFETEGAVTEDVLEKIARDPRLVEPELQKEYARSWMEGRFMGEQWQKARKTKLLALGD
mmetsp:Transcript_73562/g.157668  ORF Transcript_73562/g.157668 Transcript_73562/m.157668 type:complete len:1505 (-) Transcript_73562:114-4628(-)